MLSRRHVRIKVLQAVYAFFQSGRDDLSQGEKQLIHSIDKLYELYVYQLALMVKLTDFIANRVEEAKKKYFPTEEDLDPNTRFINNRFIKQLDENKDLRRRKERLRISWVEDNNMLLKIFNDIRELPEYAAYMSDSVSNYKKDKEIWMAIILQVIANDDFLRNYFEDKSIFWGDEDFETSIMMVIKTIKEYKEYNNPETRLPEIFKSSLEEENEPNEDRQFMIKLFRQTAMHSEEYDKWIESQVENWELERIALMDMIIMKLALAELINFPSIPVKVTINEYIEISKSYSSLKSKLFINGILDKLSTKLKEEGVIRKSGRGLIE